MHGLVVFLVGLEGEVSREVLGLVQVLEHCTSTGKLDTSTVQHSFPADGCLGIFDKHARAAELVPNAMQVRGVV